MNTLTETQTKINSDWYVASIANEALKAAECAFLAESQKDYFRLDWDTFARIYLQVWGKAENVDLSTVAIPAFADPHVTNINTALADDPDYQDWLAQSATGIPMF